MIYFSFFNFFILNNSYSPALEKIISLNFILAGYLLQVPCFGIIVFQMLIVFGYFWTSKIQISKIHLLVILVLSLRIKL